MKTVRKVLFWLHLSAGVLAGVVILIMSVTGVALTYERQIVEWSGRHLRSTPPTPGAKPLTPQALLEVAQRDRPDLSPTALTMRSSADAPVVVAAEPETLYLDAYSGASLGERGDAGVRTFMSDMRSWHRWLAAEGTDRVSARAVTGWSNLLFLFIVASGLWIWVPRVWTWAQFKSVLLFRRRYGTGKARDFNWHNVIGIWSAVPLFIVVLSAVPISFPWASDLVYRTVGEEPPARRGPGGPGAGRGAGPRAPGQGTAVLGRGGAARQGPGGAGGPRRGVRPSGAVGTHERSSAESARVDLAGLDRLWAQAAIDQKGWRSLNVRLPRDARAPFVFSIDRGDGGQPHLRSTLTLDRTGAVVARETFADQTLGRQIRSIMRFAHTGEVLGIPGQTIAGLVSAGGVVMVWTGLALTLRRFRAWRARAGYAFRPPVGGAVTETSPQGWVDTPNAHIVARGSARPSQESAS